MSSPARLRTRSGFDGLDRRSLPFTPVLGQSLGAAMPASMALTIPFTLTAVAGNGAWLCVVIAGVLLWLVNRALCQFSTRVAAAGSMYSYAVLGLGPVGGMVAAVAMLVGYGLLGSWCLVRAAITTTELLAPARPPGAVGVAEMLVAIILTGACAAVLLIGVRLSTRVTLVAASVSFLALVGLLITAVAHSGLPTLARFSLEHAEPAGMAHGVVLSVAYLVGFGCATSLSAETATPFASVPRATSTALVVVVATCLTSTILGPTPVDGIGSILQWFPPEANHDMAVTVVRAVRLLCYAGCVVAVATALSRLVLTLAREGALPMRLGATHPRFRTPTGAIGVSAALVLGPAAVALLALPDERAIVRLLGDASTVALLTAYTLTCLAATSFLQRIDELRRSDVVTNALGAAAMLAVLVAMTVEPWGGESHTAVLTTLVCATGGVLWSVTLEQRRPWALTKLGLYDETLAGDAYDLTLGSPASWDEVALLHGRRSPAPATAVAVLDAIVDAGPGVTAREITTRTGLPTHVTSRVLARLVAAEVVVRTRDLGGFALARRVAEIATPAAAADTKVTDR
ncbi:amino acid permease [Mumia zhuanghuii]|uniref:MarR family transcriptional regulator n=2 Tax=Mumia TaxID=1546255 RepID=A0ABW1QJ05_9ACTN|nr:MULTISPECIES: amino acid permease [Mumia]KAA1424542.1 amino acid permease [Mumia zhuanghuii]